jgi:acyl carrier protein
MTESQDTNSPQRIEDDVRRILREKLQEQGEDFDGVLSADTQLVGGLGLDSVTIVSLSMTLAKHYGRKFPFQELVFRDQRFHDFTVRELVDFLARHMAG